MEGVVSTNLLTNGWVTSCFEGWADDGPTFAWDSDPDIQADGGNYSGVKGEITNGDGSVIDPNRPVACLADGRVVLRWWDHGVGMTEDVRRQAFEPFVTTRTGGTGLGLAVVYAAVAEHGGTIAIDSVPGGGTVVTVELPIQRGIE